MLQMCVCFPQVGAHDSAEDARAALDLVALKVSHGKASESQDLL